jgi:opacity protein-like surface antigen
MKRLLVAVAAIVGLSLPAVAQTTNWTGPYVGLQGGYGWGDSNGGLTISGFPIPYHPHPDGVIGGGHAGYLWQWGHWVFGAEGDLEGADITGSDTETHIANKVESRNNLDASLRGKAGFAIDRVLLYGTAGVAFGQVKTEYSCPTCNHPTGPGSPYDVTSGVRIGWTAGAGAEFTVTPKWSVAAEYRYTDLGSKGFADPVTTATDSGNHFTFNAVTIGVSYHFLPPRPPAPPPPPIVPVMAPEPMPEAMAPAPHAFVVYFQFDRYDLTPEAAAVVRAAAKAFRATGYARIEITGYTDLAGTQAYNLALSKRRADTVSRYLAHLGVPRGAMEVAWRGKSHPRVPTPDGMRDPRNRRVEILMP